MEQKSDDPAAPFQLLENVWIPLSDGCKLGARIWLPDGAAARPVPAILEYLPYRKDDGTVYRDSVIHPFFAAAGYAAVRVDMRGSGDSDGILRDEYLPQEQQDALEVISWLAAQPWCSGNVGMMGISWGGFNSLQVAAHRPPALKAIVTMCSTDDRYTDDCHFMGGCMLGSDMLNWASYMLAYNALPPNPVVVGDRWREIWLDRLENNSPFVETWVSHQQRDAYWKQGSVDEDYSAITCAVYAVGGWVDPYTNSVPRLLEKLPGPRKGLIGPWAHRIPHRGVPGPAIGFLGECVRWWDYWLKGVDTGVMDEPMLRLWMPDAVRPEPCEAEWPGRWVAEAGWPPPASWNTYVLSDNRLVPEPEVEQVVSFRGSQLTGMTAGVWCPYGREIGQPISQEMDDSLSLCFTSAPVDEPVEILGFPRIELKIAVDRPDALLAARLCDVAPDGTSRLISWGLLNLCHRESHQFPSPMMPDQVYQVSLQLNVVAHKLAAGHRWRVSVSPTYWPHAWPSPEAVRLDIHTGRASRLLLPTRQPNALDAMLQPFGPPDGYPPMAVDWLREEKSERELCYDVKTEVLRMTDTVDEGRCRYHENGLVHDFQARNVYSIREGDPLSAQVRCEREVEVSRGDWRTRVETQSRMTADADHFYLTNSVTAYEGDSPVFSREWKRMIPRQMV